jgi:hypothetical protein
VVGQEAGRQLLRSEKQLSAHEQLTVLLLRFLSRKYSMPPMQKY